MKSRKSAMYSQRELEGISGAYLLTRVTAVTVAGGAL